MHEQTVKVEWQVFKTFACIFMECYCICKNCSE